MDDHAYVAYVDYIIKDGKMVETSLMGDSRNARNISVGKSEGKRLLSKTRCVWEGQNKF